MYKLIMARIPAFALICLLVGSVAHADIMLLQDGRGLFNVVLDDHESTQSRPLRVRYRLSSFVYDFPSRSVSLVEGHAGYFGIADIVTTTVEFGKEQAHMFMLEQGWHQYSPPPPVIIVPPTPTPTPVPTAPPKELLRPGELAETTLPLQQRIEKQLNIFIKDQISLAERIRFELAVPGGTVTREIALKARIELLRRQEKILSDYYPAEENRVQKAREALQAEIEEVKKNGKFGHEY